MNNIYWESFKTFFKIGIFTLGGGYAMIPLIEEEVVNKKQWVSKDEMLDLIAIAQSCPGVFAINIATFIGYKLNKVRGAIATTLGTALPSFLIILAIAIFFKQFEDNKVVAAIFRGIRPAVVALIAVPYCYGKFIASGEHGKTQNHQKDSVHPCPSDAKKEDRV